MTPARKRKHSWGGVRLLAVALLPLLVPEAWGAGCPHHATFRGGHAGDHDSPTQQHGQHGGKALASQDAGHRSHAGHESDNHRSDDGSERSDSVPCDCAGGCPASSVLSVLQPDASLALAQSGAGFSSPEHSEDVLVTPRSPYVLPFANAPPFSDPSEVS